MHHSEVDAVKVEAGLLVRARQMAASALSAPRSSPQALIGLAELCRKAGALDEALALAEKAAPGLASQRDAALRAVLAGLPPVPPDREGAWPIPFVRIRDFLDGRDHAAIETLTREALPRFEPSEVVKEGHGLVDKSKRMSWIGPVAALKPLFLERVHACAERERVLDRLGLTMPEEVNYEVQLTCSSNGCFFKPHTDDGKHLNRVLTFVYYFSLGEKRFTGGDLLLFDSQGLKPGFTSATYSRIAPEPNSIVFFPSSALHEVEVVSAASDALEDGRFTLNGWMWDGPLP